MDDCRELARGQAPVTAVAERRATDLLTTPVARAGPGAPRRSRQISDRVAPDFGRPPVLRAVDTEQLGVDPATVVGAPSLAARQELLGGQVVLDDLRVDPCPAVAALPQLDDSVVEALALLEVCGEPAAGAGLETTVAQQRTGQHREVAARADDPLTRLARDVKGVSPQAQQRPYDGVRGEGQARNPCMARGRCMQKFVKR